MDVLPVPLSASQNASVQARNGESQNGGSDAWHVWDWSQDDHGDFRQLRDSSSAPPGPAFKCWPRFWGQQACIQEKIWKAGEQSFISGLCRFEQSSDKAALSFLFPRRERRSGLGGCSSDHEGGYSRSKSRPLRLSIKGSRLTGLRATHVRGLELRKA